MSDLSGQPGQVRMCIEIKRAATGQVEKYELVGKMVSNDEQEVIENGNTSNSDEKHGD